MNSHDNLDIARGLVTAGDAIRLAYASLALSVICFSAAPARADDRLVDAKNDSNADADWYTNQEASSEDENTRIACDINSLALLKRATAFGCSSIAWSSNAISIGYLVSVNGNFPVLLVQKLLRIIWRLDR